MTERPNIVGPEYIADLLGMDLSTVKAYSSRKPDSLPPRLNIPGMTKLRWVEADVLDWLNSFRPKTPEEKKKIGRPVSPAYRQSLRDSGGSTV